MGRGTATGILTVENSGKMGGAWESFSQKYAKKGSLELTEKLDAGIYQ